MLAMYQFPFHGERRETRGMLLIRRSERFSETAAVVLMADGEGEQDGSGEEAGIRN
jgi:hypothetical protein